MNYFTSTLHGLLTYLLTYAMPPANVSCPICHESHYYRNCNHPCIEQIHNIALDVFVSYRIDPTHTARPRANTLYWIPAPVKRALLLKYTPQSLHADCATLREWRELYRDDNWTSPGIATHVPVRVGVISAASQTDLVEMIAACYTRIAEDHVRTSPHLQGMRSARFHASNLATILRTAARDIGRANLTPSGFNAYSTDLVRYIQEATEHVTDATTARISPNLTPEFLSTYRHHSTGNTNTIHYNTLSANVFDIQQDSELRARILHAVPAPPIVAQTQANRSGRDRLRRRRPPVFQVDLQMAPNPIADMQALQHTTCTICWDTTTTETACSTDCGHMYCNDCINAHIRVARTNHITRRIRGAPALHCAMCRHNIQHLTHYSARTAATNTIFEIRVLLHSGYNGTTASTPTPITPVSANENENENENENAEAGQSEDGATSAHSGLVLLEALTASGIEG